MYREPGKRIYEWRGRVKDRRRSAWLLTEMYALCGGPNGIRDGTRVFPAPQPYIRQYEYIYICKYRVYLSWLKSAYFDGNTSKRIPFQLSPEADTN